MTFRDAVAGFAADWLAALDDTVTVRTNAAGQGVYDPVLRTYAGTGTVVYTGVALVRPTTARRTEYGGAQVELVDYDVYLPAGTTGLAPDQQLTVDTTGTASPLLAGQVMTVHVIEADTFNARIRLGCTLNRGAG